MLGISNAMAKLGSSRLKAMLGSSNLKGRLCSCRRKVRLGSSKLKAKVDTLSGKLGWFSLWDKATLGSTRHCSYTSVEPVAVIGSESMVLRVEV